MCITYILTKIDFEKSQKQVSATILDHARPRGRQLKSRPAVINASFQSDALNCSQVIGILSAPAIDIKLLWNFHTIS